MYKFYKSPNKEYLIIFFIVIVLYHITYGISTLNPTNINWLMSVYHDWGTHYLGWAFYRNDPWSYPLGNMQSYYYPIGTNVGYTDTIPLMAFIFKLFSWALPEHFQFFGLWLLFCNLMLAYYLIKIFKLYKINFSIIVLAIIIIIANPVLLFRGIHPSLCAHWLLVASLYNYLIDSDRDKALKINKLQVLLFVLSATINPYLAAMMAGFTIIIPLKHYLFDKTIKVKELIFFPFIAFVSAIFFWIIFGLLEFNKSTNLEVENVYGLYSFNLNSFFNAYGFYSKIIPHLGMVTDKQHEGFGYFGVGIIIILIVSVASIIYKFICKKPISKKLIKFLPLFILCFFLLLFSVTNDVSWGNKILFTYKVPLFVEKLGGIFRAHGRFIWPVYYTILIFSIIIFSKIEVNKYVKIAVLVVLTVVQLYDIENLLVSKHYNSTEFTTKLQYNKWLNIYKGFDEIITYPPYTNNMVYAMDYQDLSFIALNAGKPITNGYAAREDISAIQEFKDTLATKLKRGEINNNQVFITTENYIDNFDVLIHQNKVDINKLDDFIFIYKKNPGVSKIFGNSMSSQKFTDSIFNLYKKQNNIRPVNNEFKETYNVLFNVEKFHYDNNVLNISGWAFNKDKDSSKGDSIFISLSGEKHNFLIPVDEVKRPDLVEVYTKDYNTAGFSKTVFTDNIPKENYQVGLVIKDGRNKTYSYSKSDMYTAVGQNQIKEPNILKDLPPHSSEIISNLDVFELKGNYIKINGWAALENHNSENKKISIVLISEKRKYIFQTDMVIRNDVTAARSNKFNYNFSGFSLKAKKNLEKGRYKIGVIITDNQTNKSFFKDLNKVFEL
jgi:hypothetical protein